MEIHPRIVDGGTAVLIIWTDPTIKLATPLRAIAIFTAIDILVERTE